MQASGYRVSAFFHDMNAKQIVSKERRMRMIGQRFGILTVLSEAEPSTDSIGRSIPRFRCVCDCGKEIIVNQNMLKNGIKTSCGCTRFPKGNRIDLSGQKFRKLTVISEAEPDFNKDGKLIRRGNCVCECGKHTVIRQTNLTRPNGTKSCGCMKGRHGTPPNLIGNKYGLLTVLSPSEAKLHASGLFRRTWACRCNCGNKVVVSEDKLLSGKTRSCGCLKWHGLKGWKSGKLTVLSPAFMQKDRRYWKCKCECGNEITVSQDDLFWGSITSCGCDQKQQKEDLTGQRFGKLTAIREVTPIQSARGPLRAWLCRCDCGREVIVRQKNLVGKVTRSCGCLRKEKAKKRGRDI